MKSILSELSAELHYKVIETNADDTEARIINQVTYGSGGITGNV